MVAVKASRWCSWQLGESFARAFPPDRLSKYEDFLQLPGVSLKREGHRNIRQISAPVANDSEAGATFILKEYPYSMVRRLRSWHRIATSQREFNALVFCREHGIPAVEPVGFGVQRSLILSVKSCFLITVYAAGYMPLRDWLRARKILTEMEKQALEELVREVGYHIRTAHAERFFFFRLLAKNILVRQDAAGKLEWLLLDQCYARHLPAAALARSGQMRDIGALLGSLARYGGADYVEAFYSGYLPDPLGADEAQLRRRALSGIRIYKKQTPLKRLLHRFKIGHTPPSADVCIDK